MNKPSTIARKQGSYLVGTDVGVRGTGNEQAAACALSFPGWPGSAIPSEVYSKTRTTRENLFDSPVTKW